MDYASFNNGNSLLCKSFKSNVLQPSSPPPPWATGQSSVPKGVHNVQITENLLTKQKKGSEISGLIICVVLPAFWRLEERKGSDSSLWFVTFIPCLAGRHHRLKVHKTEIFFGFDFEICIISLLVMSKY